MSSENAEVPSTKDDTNEEVDNDEDIDNFKEEIERLVRRHRNEKHAPELLPFDLEMVESIQEMLHFVEKILQEDRASGEQGPTHPGFYLRSTEKERLTYLLTDYLRIRQRKLEKFPLHYLEPERQSFLSSAERVSLREYWDVKRLYFENRLALNTWPENKKPLDEVYATDHLDMVRRPCLQSHIYAKIHGDLGQLESTRPSSQGSTQDTKLTLDVGDTYLIRYEVIRQFLIQPEHDGKVQLV